MSPEATHQVLNQPPPHVGHNVYTDDMVLFEAVTREGAGWAHDELTTLGAMAGDTRWLDCGDAANRYPPQLATHDRFGHRIDEVRFHPTYHDLMAAGVAMGLHAAPWRPDAPTGSHVARAAKTLVWTRVDAGHICPLSMTYAVVPTLRTQPQLAEIWEPRVTSGTYDPTYGPAQDKAGALFGMAMTEKQGGSDVRANTTRAEPIDGSDAGDLYALTGHKWFCSAPMNDAFLVLAQAGPGLSCLLVPRWLPDGTRNTFRLQRLKDKLGNRSNASAEVEFDQTLGWLISEPGQGVRTIIEMVAHTRLDCAVGAAASMRHGLSEAAWHVAHRRAFGRRLADQPLMRAVIADLAIESEAATVLAMRLARSFDATSSGDAIPSGADDGFRRLVTPVAKYWLCKRAPGHAAEALECLGGNGYVEESGMPRLFRESPLNGIWEGSGNVQCLDVLRALQRSPASVDVLMDEIRLAEGANRHLDAAIEQVAKDVTAVSESDARWVVERLAVTLQGSLLVRHSPAAVADAFCATRLGHGSGHAYGSFGASVDVDAVMGRALPILAA